MAQLTKSNFTQNTTWDVAEIGVASGVWYTYTNNSSNTQLISNLSFTTKICGVNAPIYYYVNGTQYATYGGGMESLPDITDLMLTVTLRKNSSNVEQKENYISYIDADNNPGAYGYDVGIQTADGITSRSEYRTCTLSFSNSITLQPGEYITLNGSLWCYTDVENDGDRASIVRRRSDISISAIMTEISTTHSHRIMATGFPSEAYPVYITLWSDPAYSNIKITSPTDYYDCDITDLYGIDYIIGNDYIISSIGYTESGNNPTIINCYGDYEYYMGPLHGTITFVNDNELARPSYVTATRWEQGSEYEDVTFTVTGSSFTYSYGDGFSYGDECLTFHEINGYTLTTSPENDEYCNRKDVTYTKVIPTSGLVKGTITFTDSSNQYGIRPTSVDLKLYTDGTLRETIVIDTSSSTTDSFSFTFNGSYTYANVTVSSFDVSNYSEHISFYYVDNYLACNINYKINSAWENYVAHVYTNDVWTSSQMHLYNGVEFVAGTPNVFIYSESPITITTNSYGVTGILNNYTTESNDNGTTVIIG